ncbi:putative amidase At4g34880 [Silene latifolia]|uniref:putative amidase At4g34880 n=1 Tax=Silene latifolia TaxID=37657 RepID=UPI003D7726B4
MKYLLSDIMVQNLYNVSAVSCGSSSGSAIAVAANMVAVSLGTVTDGSILCPSNVNSVVGIKPTVGLTSRSGVIPISPRQDTVGPICRTVADAVHCLYCLAGRNWRKVRWLRMSNLEFWIVNVVYVRV